MDTITSVRYCEATSPQPAGSLPAAAVQPGMPDAAEPRVHEHLTRRQASVVDLLSRGKSNKQIARDLGVTEGTVKAHLAVIFEKLGLYTRVEVAVWWVLRDR